MKDRIRQIMESQHMTQQVFANCIGTTPATLSGIFNDRTRPTINIIESIKKKFPDISLEWLMFGIGDMYQTSSTPLQGDQQSPIIPPSMGQNVQDQVLDFSSQAAPTPSFAPQQTPSYNSVRNTHQEMSSEEVKIVDKPMRKVTEIRVYYDDQTWESFVPSKK